MAWITLEEVKAIMKKTTTEYDDLINILIPYVQNLFIKESGYDPEEREATEKMELNNTDRVVLSRYPLTSIAHIKVSSGAFIMDLTSTSYTAYKKGIIVFKFRITGIVEVQYTAGYSIANIPLDIKDGLIIQIIDFVEKLERLGVKTTGKMGESISYYDIPLLPEFDRLCKAYTNPIPNRETI